MLTYVGVVAVLNIVFFGVGSMYIFMDVTNQPKFLRKYKIQPDTNEPVDSGRLKDLFW